MRLVDGWVLNGSLSSFKPASFGLFACLDFGPCPLFFFLFIKFSEVPSFYLAKLFVSWIALVKPSNFAGFIFTEDDSKIMPTHALLLVENASLRIQHHTMLSSKVCIGMKEILQSEKLCPCWEVSGCFSSSPKWECEGKMHRVTCPPIALQILEQVFMCR
jgi:hypothetical protein